CKREQLVGDLQPKSLGGLQIDHQLELGRLDHWQIGRFLAFEDPTCIDADLTVHVENVDPIAHQAASDRKRKWWIVGTEWRAMRPQRLSGRVSRSGSGACNRAPIRSSRIVPNATSISSSVPANRT